jgi:hypothetical protein
MSTISISIPDSLRQRAEAIAHEDGQELESFVTTVLSQRVAVAEADSYIRRRGSRGSAEQMRAILSHAPAVEPPDYDAK